MSWLSKKFYFIDETTELFPRRYWFRQSVRNLQIKYGIGVTKAFWIIVITLPATLLSALVAFYILYTLVDGDNASATVNVLIFILTLVWLHVAPMLLKRLYVRFNIMPSQPLSLDEQMKLIEQGVTGRYKWDQLSLFLLTLLLLSSVILYLMLSGTISL